MTEQVYKLAVPSHSESYLLYKRCMLEAFIYNIRRNYCLKVEKVSLGVERRPIGLVGAS